MLQRQVALMLAHVTAVPYFVAYIQQKAEKSIVYLGPSRTLTDRSAISVFVSGVTSEHVSQIYPTSSAQICKKCWMNGFDGSRELRAVSVIVEVKSPGICSLTSEGSRTVIRHVQ